MTDDSDDEFGLSSGDEAELMEVGDHPAATVKRKADTILHESAKRPRHETDVVAVANRVLRDRFGKEAFRLKQESAIERLLQGESAAIIFPTGGGKSLCYQVPALCFKELDRIAGVRQGPSEGGITLVVSPLIALMKDQVDSLKHRGISAAVLDSTRTKQEYLDTVESMRNGTLDILYCAPERLNNEAFVASMARIKGGIRLLAVDEAHCVSEWGHAFRPDYLKVSRFSTEVGARTVVCLTATATPTVANDMCRAFDIAPSAVFRTSSYRPNLHLYAAAYQTKQDSFPQLCHFLKAHPGSTIIYVTLQKHAEELSQKLGRQGFGSVHFHAGMNLGDKISAQERFMAAKDLIIVATIAFGMGIDKTDIRNVIHYDIPRSLEGYSQEIGRAGRDGRPSHCMLYLCAEDLHIRESFARGDLPSKQPVSTLLNEVMSTKPTLTDAGAMIELSLYQLSKDFDIKSTVLNNILAQLELRFKLLRATTPRYTSYTYEAFASIDQDSTPAAAAIRAASRKATKLWHVDVDAAVRRSGVARETLVSKLQEWHDGRLIDLKTSGVVNRYRLLQRMPGTQGQRQDIINELYANLEYRERQELQRMDQMIDLVTGKTCFARTLASHFGDSLSNGSDACGQCTWCETKQAVERVMPPKRAWDSNAFFNVLKACPERDDPRYLARIAFGIRSPRVSQAKLDKHAVFESMADHHFEALLKAFTKVCEEG